MNWLESRLTGDNLTGKSHNQPQGVATEKAFVDHICRALIGEELYKCVQPIRRKRKKLMNRHLTAITPKISTW